jgi:outer membrane protein assembly factor BamB
LTSLLVSIWVAAIATAHGLESWGQAQGGAAHTGYIVEAPAPPYQEAWRFGVAPGGPDRAFGLSAPVVAGSTVVAVGPRAVVAADLHSGEPVWTVDRTYGPSVSPAFALTPHGGVLLYTQGFGDSPPGTSPTPSTEASASPAPSSTEPFASNLTAIDLATQEPIWDGPLQLKEVSRTGVTVDGDTAFVGDNRGNVYAVDVATGKLRWSEKTGGFLANPLASADGSVVVAIQGGRTTRARLMALAEGDGSETWNIEIQGAALFATSPVIGDGQVIVGLSDQTVRAFDLSDGSERWSARLNGPVFFTGAPALTPDAVVVLDSFGQVYRLDPATGERMWDFALNVSTPRTPVVVAGEHVLVATSTGQLVAIDLGSGRLVWKSPPGDAMLRSLTLTPDIVVGVRGGPEGGLVAFSHDGNGTLVSEASPTELDLPALLGAFAAAAIGLFLLLALGGRALTSRMGPAFLDDGEGGSDATDVGADP